MQKKMFVIGCILLLTIGLTGCVSKGIPETFEFDTLSHQRTHFYELPGLVKIIGINGELRTGPWNYDKNIYVRIQTSVDNTTWHTLDEVKIRTGKVYYPFHVEGNNTPARYFRFTVYQSLAFVDGSRGTLTYMRF